MQKSKTVLRHTSYFKNISKSELVEKKLELSVAFYQVEGYSPQSAKKCIHNCKRGGGKWFNVVDNATPSPGIWNFSPEFWSRYGH